VVERYRYDAYGDMTVEDVDGKLTGSQYGFTGRRSDSETSLWYLRARYYSESLGRFVSRDPIGYFDGLGMYIAYFVPTGKDPSGKYNVSGAFSTIAGQIPNPPGEADYQFDAGVNPNPSQDGSCSKNGVRYTCSWTGRFIVTLINAEITLRPEQWTERVNPTTEQVSRWVSFVATVVEHEQGHLDVAKGVAATMNSSLSEETFTEVDCDVEIAFGAMLQAMNERADDILTLADTADDVAQNLYHTVVGDSVDIDIYFK